MKNCISSTDTVNYFSEKTKRENKILERAFKILESRVKTLTDALSSPNSVSDYLKIALQKHDSSREFFGILWMNSQNAVVGFEIIGNGTINQCSVYPREVIKSALAYGANAAIIAHNHPSGSLVPSNADLSLTKHIKQALSAIDVRLLDHIIVSGNSSMSFASKGLL